MTNSCPNCGACLACGRGKPWYPIPPFEPYYGAWWGIVPPAQPYQIQYTTGTSTTDNKPYVK